MLSVIICFYSASRPIVNFWIAPPKRRRYSYSAYGVRRHYLSRADTSAKPEQPREPAVELPDRRRELELVTVGEMDAPQGFEP